MRPLTDYEKNLIDYLRTEADQVKDCFTQFSFQVVAVAAVALGLIARFQPNFPLLGLASVSVVLMALSVGRIGVHKYTTANRIHGYELYLDRVRRLGSTSGWKNEYTDVGWEEVLRAWRTVQPTLFRLYYEWGRNIPNTPRREFEQMEYPWFEPEKLHVADTVYYAGNYLRTMFLILFMIVALGLISMIAMCVQLFLSQSWYAAWAATASSIITLAIAYVKVAQLRQRRRLLEGGILCIHSCAIIWQLVVVAHHRAMAALPIDQNGQLLSFEGYTRHLSQQAAELRRHLLNRGSPHSWMHAPAGSHAASTAG
jgi:hypothetical protein